MKVLLVNPPQTFYPGSDPPAGNLPLGLMYIAAVLQKNGYAVEIMDAFMAGAEFEEKNGEAVTIGLPLKRIEEEIRSRNPDIVGIAGPFTSQIGHAIAVSKAAKEANPNILTVVGGPHITLVPKEFLEEAKTVDIAVTGEGEYAMLEIAQYFEGKKSLSEIKGIVYRQNGAVTVNERRPFIEDLDELPYPAYDLVDMESYLNPKKIGYRSFQNRAVSMVTSRGCPFNCCFCAVHLHMGQGFRAHSAEYVLNHIQFVVDKYKVKNIFFEDDNLTLDLKRFEAICDGIISRKIKIGWETPNGVRADCLNLELLRKMKQSGANSIFVGVESGDQRILDKVICKSLDLNRVVEFAKNAKEIDLKTGAFYIIGFPGETKENMQRTVDFALMLKRKYDVGMHLFAATPSYGTRLYEECKAKGYLPADLSWNSFAQARQAKGMPLITTNEFTPAEVKEIAAKALAEYKRLSLMGHIKHPGKALRTAFDQPQLIWKYIKNLTS
ncbi:MAG: B12-binding domain-containing radical SAM protein [Candidatus Bathyarchaeota archaeon]|nr:B12-binding domain-containing radical SAM protein [Chloroflexota bacterium]MCL5877910.1 B12-binding domain-containing radical SAM protein [Candidatus Bathyarchaeota archaeon]